MVTIPSSPSEAYEATTAALLHRARADLAEERVAELERELASLRAQLEQREEEIVGHAPPGDAKEAPGASPANGDGRGLGRRERA